MGEELRDTSYIEREVEDVCLSTCNSEVGEVVIMSVFRKQK